MLERDREKRAEEELQKGIAAWEGQNNTDAWEHLASAADLGSMKAGRYLALIALWQAAERGDITSKVILGTLYEFGYALPCDAKKAEEMYVSALRDNHLNREGFMLAAGADLGLGRLEATAKNSEKAKEHLMQSRDSGGAYIRKVSEIWLQSLE